MIGEIIFEVTDYFKKWYISRFDQYNLKSGGHSVIIRPQYLNMFVKDINLEKIYKRKNLTLKIFYRRYKTNTKKYYWTNGHLCDCNKKGDTLVENIKIQNILSVYGLSPRVYDIIPLKFNQFKIMAIVTEMINDRLCGLDKRIQTVKDISKVSQKLNIKCRDINHKTNVTGSKFVDFQGFYFKEFPQKITEEAKINLGFQESGIPYQSIEELNIKGRRDNLLRYNLMEISPDELPENFTTLDVGCNGGYFSRRAVDLGSRKVIAIDLKNVIKSAAKISYYLGYFPIDFKTKIPNDEYDLIFLLSMDVHIKNIEEIIKKTKHVLFFEGHGFHDFESYRPRLEKYFNKVKHIGTYNHPENQSRVLIKCSGRKNV